MWLKVTTHTCGTEILSPAQYACVVDYACAVANLVYKRSETKNMQIFPNLAIPTRFRKNGLTGNRTRATCVTGRDTKPLYYQPYTIETSTQQSSQFNNVYYFRVINNKV